MSKNNKSLLHSKTSDLNDSEEFDLAPNYTKSKKNNKKKLKTKCKKPSQMISSDSDSDSDKESLENSLEKSLEEPIEEFSEKISHKESDENSSDDQSMDNTETTKISKNSNEIFKELIKRQLPDVPSQWRLNINDIKRICKYIDTSIFDKNNCCLWNGYITNINNSNKGTYVNFYFRNKKVALHRLLYSNFVAPLNSSEYLKFNCDNKGICCNINHYEKYKYSKNNNGVTKKECKNKESKKEIKEVTISGAHDSNELIVDFD
ncbi:hypothetical protein [Acanthamoeba polyphaga mimivirus]|uniref:Uncharacterized protein n=2 Tax=Megamimivirinae TaxID=3044648 RepID=A0A2L2DJE2_MIMIV|nr:hypothetical protein MegaChil _gp0576 [Megavirus chiliensis]AEQ32595.1 hypothetical protein [Megavirus chiliensis]AVG46303.1 hypothetical protein [Acanthamoeba polyphaga mimivirus]AVG47414.1 hypothetical protein [Acanthamoeba polyphaga mimivirus]